MAVDNASGVMTGITRRTVGPAVEPVDPPATVQLVDTRSAEQPIVPRPTVELISSGAADQHVVASIANKPVSSPTTDNAIGAA